MIIYVDNDLIAYMEVFDAVGLVILLGLGFLDGLLPFLGLVLGLL